MSSGATVASEGSSHVSVGSNKLPPVSKGNAARLKMLGIAVTPEKKGDHRAPLLFRGFVGGDMFKTKKGYQGAKVDALWVRQIFEAYANDDVEIIDVAMKSSLADPDAQVRGGQNGSVYSIGDYGFNTGSQFRIQQGILAAHERRLAKGVEYLSQLEWETVDDNLLKYASHGVAKIDVAVRGDTLSGLAVRESAFHVSRKLMEYGVDPLLVNEDDEDVFLLLKTQYKHLTEVLSKVNADKAFMATNVVLPTEVMAINEREEEILHKLDAQVQFIDVFKGVLTERVKAIADDKVKVKRLRIRRKPIPPLLAWNVEQGKRAQDHIDESDEFKHFILERIEGQKKYNASHVNLADLVLKQNTSLIGNGGGDGDDDDDSSVNSEHRHLLMATIHQKRGVNDARARKAAVEAAAGGDSVASSESFELLSVHSEHPMDVVGASMSLEAGPSLMSGGASSSGMGKTTFKKVKKVKKASASLPGIHGVLSEVVHEDGHVAETMVYR